MPRAVAGPEIERLIQLLARLPGLGPRSARRAALALVKKKDLLLAPLALAGLYLALGQAGDPVAKVAMLEMAMPPMLGASIVALDHDLEPDLGALIIGIGVPLSMLTAWVWWGWIAAL
mgnify:CR=1 FL=1